jgi:hypothetical protein
MGRQRNDPEGGFTTGEERPKIGVTLASIQYESYL